MNASVVTEKYRLNISSVSKTNVSELPQLNTKFM